MAKNRLTELHNRGQKVRKEGRSAWGQPHGAVKMFLSSSKEERQMRKENSAWLKGYNNKSR